MKKIDFSQPGGFPLTQDQLNYLQQGFGESIHALARMGGNISGPFVISGLTITNPSLGEYSVADGWLFYNGEMVRFLADTITGAAGSMAPFVVISPSANSLLFNDGSTPPVIIDATATVVSMPTATPTDATHFPLLQLQPFGLGFGLANRETGWKSMPVSTVAADGGVTGTIFYKKNFIANTLHVRGSLTSSNAQNFAASPGSAFYLMGTLPAEYAPANTAYFNAQYFLAAGIKDDLGVAWIKQLNCGFNTFGQLFIGWVKPEVAIGSYSVNINSQIPLD